MAIKSKSLLERLGIKKPEPEKIPEIKKDKENLSGKEQK